MLTNGQGHAADFERARGRQALESVAGREEMRIQSPDVYPLADARRESGEALSPRTHPRERMRTLLRGEERHHVGGDTTPLPVSGEFGSLRQAFAGLVEGFRSVGERWSLGPGEMAKLLHLENEMGLCQMILAGQIPPITGDLKDRMAMIIGISVGLGDLFDDDEVAERKWMCQERDQLDGNSAVAHMQQGDFFAIRAVLELVEEARGLR